MAISLEAKRMIPCGNGASGARTFLCAKCGQLFPKQTLNVQKGCGKKIGIVWKHFFTGYSPIREIEQVRQASFDRANVRQPRATQWEMSCPTKFVSSKPVDQTNRTRKSQLESRFVGPRIRERWRPQLVSNLHKLYNFLVHSLPALTQLLWWNKEEVHLCLWWWSKIEENLRKLQRGCQLKSSCFVIFECAKQWFFQACGPEGCYHTLSVITISLYVCM